MIFKEVHKMNELEPVYVDDFEKNRRLLSRQDKKLLIR